jgi:hypothetical protein
MNFRQLSFTDLLVNMGLISNEPLDLVNNLRITDMDLLHFHAPNLTKIFSNSYTASQLF